MSTCRASQKKRRICYSFSWLVVFALVFMIGTGHALAAKDKYVKNAKGVNIAKYDDEGRMVMITSKDSNVNYHNITDLVSNNKKKTIVIPPGTISINGVIKPGSNTTIIADGATIYLKEKSNAVFCAPNKKVKNLTIKGGKWRSPHEGGWTGSIFQIAFAKNVVLDGVDCNANYKGHAIEIIACQNVTIKNCKVMGIGSSYSTCHEEQIQIDIATKTTAPLIAAYGSKYAQGQTCKNIKILNNTVKGARAVGVNWTFDSDGKYRNKFHENIIIRGNKLTGTTSEALALFNVIGGEVSGNTIKTLAPADRDSYSIGIHIALEGVPQGSQSTKMKKSTLKISRNKIWGNRNGIHIKAYYSDAALTACLARFGTIEVTDNKVWCKTDPAYGIWQVRDSSNLINSGNTCALW